MWSSLCLIGFIRFKGTWPDMWGIQNTLSLSHNHEKNCVKTSIFFENHPFWPFWTFVTVHFKSFSKHRPSGPMLSISRNVRPSVCLFVCLSVCSLLEVPFNGLFAPTSRSRMSNIVKDSESLGKSNGKKWSHIQTFLFGSGLKSPRKKKFIFRLILFYKTWWKPRFPMD